MPDAPRNISLVYARLSGVQGDEISPAIQVKKARALAQSLGFAHDPDRDTYADDAEGMHSAHKRTNIPRWYALLERCQQDAAVAAVLVYDHARAFRSVKHMLSETETLNRAGVKLIRVRGGEVDLLSADGRRRAIDDANAAEYHSRKTSELLRDHYAELKEQGVYFSHRPPLGLDRSGSAPNVVWTPNADFPMVLEILSLYLDGLGAGRIAGTLAARGRTWPTRPGLRRPPNPATVRLLIRRVEKYKPFLDPVLYERVVQRRAARAHHRENQRRAKHPPLLLALFLRCRGCGARYYTNHHRRVDGTPYGSYLHPDHVVCANPRRWLHAELVEDQVWEQLEQQLAIPDALKPLVEARLSEPPPEPAPRLDYELQKTKLSDRLDRYFQMWSDGDFGADRDRYLRLVQETRAELAELTPPPEPLPHRAVDLAVVRLLLETPIRSLREAAPHDPQAAHAFLRDVLYSAEVWDRTVEIALKPELAALVDSS